MPGNINGNGAKRIRFLKIEVGNVAIASIGFGENDKCENMITITHAAVTTQGKSSQICQGVRANNMTVFALYWIMKQTIVSGKDNSILDLRGKATSAEVVSMLMRCCGVKKLSEQVDKSN